jgi:signal transduction histidine kinase
MLLLLVNSRLFQYAILYRKLRELDKAKDDFISIASHELRTPITAMSGFFSMLADGSYGKISKKTKESVLFMSANVGRLQSLVEDLLNVSKLQQGKMKMDVEKCDVEKIIEETVRSLTPNAAKKKLSLKKDLQKNIFVNTDHDRLKQVLINLIGNSIKYTKKGKVTVTLTSEKGKAKIVVKDTGIGMSSSEQERLFEKFYRAQNTKTADIEGTGLGLWITKAIVELMGGKIYVNSIENTGTQVTVTIPLVITGK